MDVNLVVALSNVWGLLPIVAGYKRSVFDGTLMLITVLASILMHVTERKHGLPGLCWRQHSYLFLWLDRIMAVVTGAYGTYLYLFMLTPSMNILCCALLGFVFMTISEHGPNRYFMLTHCIWHILAYYSLYMLYNV